MLYNSLILPHPIYGIVTWGYKCDGINKLQKKAIRIVSLFKYNAHTEPIFKRLHLLKVADIVQIQGLTLYYRCMHNTLPRYLQRIGFNQNCTIHDYNTRSQNELNNNNNTTALIQNNIDTHSQTGFVTYVNMYCTGMDN